MLKQIHHIGSSNKTGKEEAPILFTINVFNVG
jgi:hypothetical protein